MPPKRKAKVLTEASSPSSPKADIKEKEKEESSSSSSSSAPSEKKLQKTYQPGLTLARAFKMEQSLSDPATVKIKGVKPSFSLYLNGYSTCGIQIGQQKEGKSASLYIRLRDEVGTQSVKSFLQESDMICKELWECIKDKVMDKFDVAEEDRKNAYLNIEGGWAQKELEAYNEVDGEDSDASKNEITIFPHRKYTKMARIHNGRSVQQEYTLDSQVDKRGNCSWTTRVMINSCLVTWNKLRKIFNLRPFHSYGLMGYLDEGQDMTVNVEEIEKQKKQKIEESMKGLTQAAYRNKRK